MPPTPGSGAVFSACRTWRYTLTREVGPGETTLMVIGLNPSTADETKDDPTIRRCIGFARSWGAGRLVMTNLFAYRATDPMQMMGALVDPVGPDNDAHLCEQALAADLILAAWGIHGSYLYRDSKIRLMLGARPMTALGFTKSGAPKHPLYVPAATQPVWYGLRERKSA